MGSVPEYCPGILECTRGRGDDIQTLAKRVLDLETYKDTSQVANERGTSMLEFSLVVGLLMMMVVAMSDLCRLFVVEMLLTKGAEDGLNVAMKIPNIDMDIRNVEPGSKEYTWYHEARRRVIIASTRLPLDAWLDDENSTSDSRLLPISVMDDQINTGGGAAPVFTYGASMIRPGERVWFGTGGTMGDTTQGYWLGHYAVPYAGLTAVAPKALLKSFPIQIELRARVEPLLPFLGTKVVRGYALGYRELNIPKSPLAPLPGETTTTSTTSTTSSTTTTVTRVTTTTVPWTCSPEWPSCRAQTLAVTASTCPDNGAGPSCGCSTNCNN